MRRFFDGRFRNGIDVSAIARDLLLTRDDALNVAGRLSLIQPTGGVYTLLPSLLPSGKLDALCAGFPAMLCDQVGQESARVARLRAAGKVRVP